MVFGVPAHWVSTLTEHVDLAALRARHQGGSDRRPDVLRRYITRCENEGDIMGNYADVRVSYYRKRGLPGRMYARSPALQWLTKESRAAALAGMSYSVDIQNCFPTLLLHEVRKLHTKDDVPLRSLELFVKYHAIWREFVKEYLQVEISEAKIAISKIFGLGEPGAQRGNVQERPPSHPPQERPGHLRPSPLQRSRSL